MIVRFNFPRLGVLGGIGIVMAVRADEEKPTRFFPMLADDIEDVGHDVRPIDAIAMNDRRTTDGGDSRRCHRPHARIMPPFFWKPPPSAMCPR